MIKKLYPVAIFVLFVLFMFAVNNCKNVENSPSDSSNDNVTSHCDCDSDYDYGSDCEEPVSFDNSECIADIFPQLVQNKNQNKQNKDCKENNGNKDDKGNCGKGGKGEKNRENGKDENGKDNNNPDNNDPSTNSCLETCKENSESPEECISLCIDDKDNKPLCDNRDNDKENTDKENRENNEENTDKDDSYTDNNDKDYANNDELEGKYKLEQGYIDILEPQNHSAFCNNEFPKLKWSEVEGTVYYEVYLILVSEDKDMYPMMFKVYDNSIEIDANNFEYGVYRWFAIAYDADGTCYRSDIADFTYAPSVPAGATPTKPEDNAKINNIPVPLTWSIPKCYVGVPYIGYEVEISDDSSFACTKSVFYTKDAKFDFIGFKKSENDSKTQCGNAPSDVLADGQYFWRVRTVIGASCSSAWSIIFSFTYEAQHTTPDNPQPIPTPRDCIDSEWQTINFIVPDCGKTYNLNNLQYSWEAVKCASLYEVEFISAGDTDNNMTVLETAIIPQPFYLVKAVLENQKSYNFRARYWKNQYDVSSWNNCQITYISANEQ